MPSEELPSPGFGFKKPVSLSTPWPRMSAGARERAEASLKSGCGCGSATATLKRRLIRFAVTVHLQCDRCGRSVSGSLPRADHYVFQDYPEWDESLRDSYYAKQIAEMDARHARAVEQKRLQTDMRRREYAEFCRTSKDWHRLCAYVIQRAKGQCEACLQASAVTAHHTTYTLGVLPPAWLLKAVCMNCHERLHADKFGLDDDWCP